MGEVVTRKRDTMSGRVLRRSLCMTHVADAVGAIERGCEIYGLTKGQWSLIDLIEHCLAYTGPAHCVLSTWTAAGADMTFAQGFLQDNRLLSLRLVVDYSFVTRQPAFTAAIKAIESFGGDSIRCCKTHAKFVLLRNDEWNVVIRTSMNLNENRRIENFEVSDSVALADYLQEFVDALWAERTPEDLFAKAGEHERQLALFGENEAAVEVIEKTQENTLARYVQDGPGVTDVRRVGLSRR